MNTYKALFTALTTLPLFVSSGCTSYPPMSDPQSYKTMNCEQLKNEQIAVDANSQAHEENSQFGVAEVLTIAVAGMGAYTGDTSATYQAQQNMEQLDAHRSNSAESAEAYEKRSELITQVMTIRKCQ